MTDAQRESHRRWREKNPDKVRKYVREYMREVKRGRII